MEIALGLAALLLIGNAQIKPERVARSMERSLRGRLGNVGEVEVKVFGPRGYKALRGNFREVRVSLRGVDLDKLNLDMLSLRESSGDRARIRRLLLDVSKFTYQQIDVSHLLITIDDVVYDRRAARHRQGFQLVSVGKAEAIIEVGLAALRKAVSSRLTEFIQPELSLEEGHAVVTAKKEILGLPVPLIITGVLAPRREREIHLVSPQVTIGRVAVLDLLTEKLLGDVNPLIVLDPDHRWPFAPRIGSVKIHPDGIEVLATLSFTHPRHR